MWLRGLATDDFFFLQRNGVQSEKGQFPAPLIEAWSPSLGQQLSQLRPTATRGRTQGKMPVPSAIIHPLEVRCFPQHPGLDREPEFWRASLSPAPLRGATPLTRRHAPLRIATPLAPGHVSRFLRLQPIIPAHRPTAQNLKPGPGHACGADHKLALCAARPWVRTCSLSGPPLCRCQCGQLSTRTAGPSHHTPAH